MQTEQFIDNQKVKMFQRRLLENPKILRILIDLALRPSQVDDLFEQQISTLHTHKSIQILTSLSEEFLEAVFSPLGGQVESKAFANDQRQPRYFQYLLKVLEQETIMETSLAYLTRITTIFCYHKPRQMILYLKQNPQNITLIFHHFYSRSIYEWLILLLEIEEINIFFEEEKMLIVNQCIKEIKKQTNQSLLCEMLENYESLLQSLLEKLTDRFDKTKFCTFIKTLLSQNCCLDFVFSLLQVPSPSKIEKSLRIFDCYLKFHTEHRLSKLTDFDDEVSFCEISLNHSHVQKIKKFLSTNTQLFKNEENRMIIVNYLNVVKLMMKIEPQFGDSLVDDIFAQSMLKLMLRYESNNILHNKIKQIFMQTIDRNFTLMFSLLTKPNSIFKEIMSQIGSENSHKSYENQIHHIFMYVLKKSQQQNDKLLMKEWNSPFFDSVKTKITQKQIFYDKLICGNPKIENSFQDSGDKDIFDFFHRQPNKFHHSPESNKYNHEPIDTQTLLQCNLPLESDESSKLSDNFQECLKNEEEGESMLRLDSCVKCDDDEETTEKQCEGSFMKHFSSYLSFSADDLIRYEQI